MIFWLWVFIVLLAVPPITYRLVIATFYLYVRWQYPDHLTRIFQERPPE